MFDCNPIYYGPENENILPYDLETAGIDGYR